MAGSHHVNVLQKKSISFCEAIFLQGYSSSYVDLPVQISLCRQQWSQDRIVNPETDTSIRFINCCRHTCAVFLCTQVMTKDSFIVVLFW